MSGAGPERARRATRENPATQSLAEALGALGRIIELGDGLGLGEELDEAREIVARAGARASLAPGRTVIALAGATGSGKSSLLNALAGAPIARTAVTRPTTTRPLALLPGGRAAGRADGEASALLDWLGVDDRVVAPLAGAVPADAIILDLPDVDSDAPEHRLIAERMAAQVDALVWVLDPEKYADAVLHKDFIAPMAAHAEVTLVVLNQADRLDAASREQVSADLRRLLAREGMTGAAPILASARTGEGIDALRGALERIAQARTASALRLRADARRAATRLSERVGGGGAGAPIDGRRLAEAAFRAAGAEVVASAVRAATIHRGALSVGWPPVRWVRRFRADPLAALHLRGASPSRSSRAGEGLRPIDAVARTSLPEPSPVAVGLLRTEAHRLAADASAHLPGTARDAVLQRMDERAEAIGRELDAAVARADLGMRAPRWWSAASALQWLALAVAIAGGLWLVALWGMRDLLLIVVEPPRWGLVPWPVVFLAGGLASGALLGGIGVAAVRAGAGRRAARARRRLRQATDAVVDSRLIEPLRAERERWDELGAMASGLSQHER
ncbi:GTPase [Actinomyces marmotae]|uniref:GTPase n=1 Tax=Actinomyces marmotae TaxID=2737173 RepID=UPI0013567969|nr:GTPase [Actinomyces marmotae]